MKKGTAVNRRKQFQMNSDQTSVYDVFPKGIAFNLSRSGIKKMADLRGKTLEDIRRIPMGSGMHHFGEGSISKIQESLASHNYPPLAQS